MTYIDRLKFETLSGYIVCDDCRNYLKNLNENSVDLIVTDPPYFIDGMGDDWDNQKLKNKVAKAGIIGSRPVGMKFNRQQSYDFQNFMEQITPTLYKILKPGGFIVCFSQARLYHRAAVSFENAGFEIRDMLAWNHTGQAKAFTLRHFVKKDKTLSDEEKNRILSAIGNRKTPQLKPELEPMVLGQKPKDGTFIDNWMKWKTGLIDTSHSLDASFPGNLMTVAKPTKSEKGDDNDHLTVKPIKLLEHLIRILSIENQVVLDPFLGSGSTSIAAIKAGRKFIGIEKDKNNFQISKTRITKSLNQPTFL